MAYDDNQNPYNDEPQSQSQQEPEAKEDQDTGSEELLSKAFFQGKDLEVGARCEVEITGIHEGEVSVKYVPHDEEKTEEQPEPGQEPAPHGDSEMSSMME